MPHATRQSPALPDLAGLLPARLHIAGLRLAHGVRRRWWRLSGARVIGCRVLVFDAGERLLLIRHSYGSGKWMLPGGGLKRGENALRAARREVAEETGLGLNAITLLDSQHEVLAGAAHQVHLVAGWTADQPRPDGREVLAAEFFSHHALPEPLTSGLAERLPDLITAAKAARPRL